MYDPSEYQKWEENTQEGRIIPIDEGKKSYGLIYSRNKKKFSFESRDYTDKFV